MDRFEVWFFSLPKLVTAFFRVLNGDHDDPRVPGAGLLGAVAAASFELVREARRGGEMDAIMWVSDFVDFVVWWAIQ